MSSITVVTPRLNAWRNMRLRIEYEKFKAIVEAVFARRDDMEELDIANVLDGGPEGWEVGDEAQELWLTGMDTSVIADWIDFVCEREEGEE